MVAKSDFVKFNKIREGYVKATEDLSVLTNSLQRKYGPGRIMSMANSSEQKKLNAISAKRDKLSDSMFALLSRVSPRDWTVGVPVHWIMFDLSWEDAITHGRMSSPPQYAMGYDERYAKTLQERPNKAGGKRRRRVEPTGPGTLHELQARMNSGGPHWTVRYLNGAIGTSGYRGIYESLEEAISAAQAQANRSQSFMSFEVWSGNPRFPGEYQGITIKAQ